MATNAGHLPENERICGSSLLPAIFNIFKFWHLNELEQRALLGISTEKTLHQWKKHPEKVNLTSDLLERTSYILGIYKSLRILLPDQNLADKWITTPNDNPLFNGMPPMGRLVAGRVDDLSVVRNFLDAQRLSGTL